MAAVLIFVGYKLTKPSLFKEIYAKGTNQFYPFILTILSILLTDLLIGVLIGIGIGIYFVLKTNHNNAVILASEGNQYLIKTKRDITFLNKPELKRIFSELPNNSTVLVDLSKTQFVDFDVLELINDFKSQSTFRNITVEIRESDRKKELNLSNQ